MCCISNSCPSQIIASRSMRSRVASFGTVISKAPCRSSIIQLAQFNWVNMTPSLLYTTKLVKRPGKPAGYSSLWGQNSWTRDGGQKSPAPRLPVSSGFRSPVIYRRGCNPRRRFKPVPGIVLLDAEATLPCWGPKVSWPDDLL